MSTSDSASGGQLPAGVQTYIEARVQTCAQNRVSLVSVVLFGSAAKGGFSGDISDVDLIIVLSDDASRALRRRLGEEFARLEAVHGLRSATAHSPGGLRALIERAVGHGFGLNLPPDSRHHALNPLAATSSVRYIWSILKALLRPTRLSHG